MVENVIQTWNKDKCQCKCKNIEKHRVCEKGYVWNPTTRTCKYYVINEKLKEVLY